jgi:4'-phosphopantetheinyl transferase
MTIDGLTRQLPSSVDLMAVTYQAEEAATWRSWVSDEEMSCLDSFGARKRRREFLAGRAAARQLLATCLDTTPDQVPLRRAEDDAVDVAVPDWRVSIAHSGPHAIAAAAPHPVGMDLEHIEPRDAAIARFLFAPKDRGLVDALPYDSNAALILCWSLKEAVLKARRSGFRTSPKSVHLSVDPVQKLAYADVDGGTHWTVHYKRLEEYWGAVATPRSVGDEA